MPRSNSAGPSYEPARTDLSRLTTREREVLAFIAQGLSSVEIGDRLFRSKKTIDAHRASLARKLGMRNRVQLARLAIASGLVPSHEGSGGRMTAPMAVDGQSAAVGSPLGGVHGHNGNSVGVKHVLPLETMLEIVMATHLSFWEWDLETKRTRVSANFLAMMGYDAHEFGEHSETWRKVVHPADEAWLDVELAKHLRSKSEAFELEYRMIRKNGEARWFRMTSMIRRDGNGRPVRVMATSHAIVEPRRVVGRSGDGG